MVIITGTLEWIHAEKWFLALLGLKSSKTESGFQMEAHTLDLLLTDPQRKLKAMLNKIQSLLVFVDDAHCEGAFQALVTVSKAALAKRNSRQSSRYEDMKLEELIAGGDAFVEEERRYPIAPPALVKKKRGRPPKRKVGKKKQEEEEEDNYEDEEDDVNNNVVSDHSPSRPPRKVIAKKLDVESDNDKVLDWDFQKVCCLFGFWCVFMGVLLSCFIVTQPVFFPSMAMLCELSLAKATMKRPLHLY